MILVEAENSRLADLVGSVRVMPPNLAGKANRSLSVAFGGGLFVREGESGEGVFLYQE